MRSITRPMSARLALHRKLGQEVLKPIEIEVLEPIEIEVLED